MKTKSLLFSIFAAVVLVTSFSSCDKMKTDKFDGTYKCTTVSSSTDPDLALVVSSFKAIISMQEMEIDIDGKRTTGIEVDNDGNFRAVVEYNLIITEVDIIIEGKVSSDGSMSGTISESQDVIGVDMATRYGTFSGKK